MKTSTMWIVAGLTVCVCVSSVRVAAQSCGGTLTTSSLGTFNSPNYPARYFNNQNCQYNIQVPAGSKVLLTFDTFELQDQSTSSGCVDYVEIFDLFAANYNVGHWCGSDKPPAYLSASNSLLVRFVSNGNTRRTGFSATYWSTTSTTGPASTSNANDEINSDSCGAPDIAPYLTKIVGGTTARQGSWPWQVSLKDYYSGGHVCGGSLIGPTWVLTAAHCVETSYNNPSRWTVRLGSHIRDNTDSTQQDFSVSRIIMHEGYNMASLDNDIALMQLTRSVTTGTYIGTVCVPDFDFSTGTGCYVTGWGTTGSGSLATTLQQGDVPLIGRSTCNLSSWYDGRITDNMICAGHTMGGIDACQGDSGGPLVCYNGSKWYQAGVVSWGFGCAQPNRPGVYTNVKNYIQWIQDKLSQYS